MCCVTSTSATARSRVACRMVIPRVLTRTAPPRRLLPVHDRIEPAMLATETPECPNQRHVADDIDHFAVDRGGLVGKIMVQGPAGGGEAEHGENQDSGNQDQSSGDRYAPRHRPDDRRRSRPEPRQ